MASIADKALSPKEAGSLLRQRREAKGMTQEQVADLLNMKNPNYVSMLEKGRVAVGKSKYLSSLIKLLGLDTDEVRQINPDLIVEMGDAPLSVSDPLNPNHLNEGQYFVVDITLMLSGKTGSVSSPTIHRTSVAAALAGRSLGGLLIDREYVAGVPVGSWLLWSDAQSNAGDLVVVEKDGGLYPAFLLADGLAETDQPLSPIHALRFKPDRIIGKVEEVRLLQIPRRN